MHSDICQIVLIVFTGYVIIYFCAGEIAENSIETDTTTVQSDNAEYQALCYEPTVADNIDIAWLANHSEVWYLEVGNIIGRLHMAEVLKGRLLSRSDNFTGMCGAMKVLHGEKESDGKFYGFGDLSASWKCHPSDEDDEEGVFLCDMSASGLSKYSEKMTMFVSYTDNKNLVLLVMCFPNAEVGWLGLSKDRVLTEHERDDIFLHIWKAGFNLEESVGLYDITCPIRFYD